ncbi:MAG TPA: hypothetical protein VGV41_01210 [Pseudolabrys sp.]|uniref:hypothetical protein n=1 Tax=Pseudolabrys sp. TaxID=1960880 RepID=UPI002DDC90D3|nr:hypothetical protein [Pseudolabrys sp.]HEV2627250.1 hypothetical protein [Pseudolabrys sp.]
MKIVVLAVVALLAAAGSASAQYTGYHGYAGYGIGSNPSSVYHQGYTTQRGTYVQPHYQSAPNTTQMDNWNTRGNVNPYTGRIGTRSPRY